jgi:hypothetical protein
MGTARAVDAADRLGQSDAIQPATELRKNLRRTIFAALAFGPRNLECAAKEDIEDKEDATKENGIGRTDAVVK